MLFRSSREKGSMYKSAQYQQEYDRATEIKEKMMKGLKGGTISMDRQMVRTIGEGYGGYIPRSNSNVSLSVINDDKAIDYKNKNKK